VWTTKWFELYNDATLRYRKSPESEIQGSIALTGCYTRVLKTKNGMVLELSFAKTGRIFANNTLLRSKNEALLRRWLDEIEAAIPKSERSFINLPTPHPPAELKIESCEWLNLLLHRAFVDMQSSVSFQERILERLKNKLNSLKKPDFIGKITVQNLNLGDSMVRLLQGGMMKTNMPNEVMGFVDVEYTGGAAITLGTEIYINWPKEKWATVTVTALLKLVKLAGRLHVFASAMPQQPCMAQFVDVPESDFVVDIQVGDKKHKLTSLPKLQDFLVTAAKKSLASAAVKPNYLLFNLPFPGRKVNVRGVNVAKMPKVRPDPPKIPPGERTLEVQEVYKMIARRFLGDVLNEGALLVVYEIFHPKCYLYGGSVHHISSQGVEAVLDFVQYIRERYRGAQFRAKRIVVQGDRVHLPFVALVPPDASDQALQGEMLQGLFVFKFIYLANHVGKLSIFWDRYCSSRMPAEPVHDEPQASEQ
jgi:hypothetical protein